MGGGSLILTLYAACAVSLVMLVGVGTVLYVVGRRREARAARERDGGREEKG